MDLFSKPWQMASIAHGQGLMKQVARAEWEKNCELLLDRYFDNGESVRQLRERLRRLYPNNVDSMTKNLLTLNLVRKLVDQKAKLYRKAPRRLLVDPDGAPVPGDHEAQPVLQRLLRAVRLNARMKWAHRLYELLNAAVIWGQADWRRRQPLLTVLPPHHLIVEQDPDDPLDLQEAAAIYVPVGGTPDSPLDGGREIGYVRYRRFSEMNGTPRMAVDRLDADFRPLADQPPELRAYSSLGAYPFILIRKGEPLGAELFPDVPHGLIHAAQWLDHELTRGAFNSQQTDFPAYVFNGTAEELGTVNPVTGAGAIICLGNDDKKLTRLAVDPREKERNRNIIFFLKMFAQANDISPSAFTFDVELLSGTAKFHDKQPEIEYREDLADQIAPVEEEDIWPMLSELALISGFDGAELLAGCRLSVDFPEQAIPLSREEELQNLKREVALGLRSPAEVLVERHGLNPEEARLRVMRNLAENRIDQEAS